MAIVPKLRSPGLTFILLVISAWEMPGGPGPDAVVCHTRRCFWEKQVVEACKVLFFFFFLAKNKITEHQSIKSIRSFQLGVFLWLLCIGSGGMGAVSITSARVNFSVWIKLLRNPQNRSTEDCLPKTRRGKRLCLVGWWCWTFNPSWQCLLARKQSQLYLDSTLHKQTTQTVIS